MSVEELIAYLTGAHPPGSHPADLTLADVLLPVTP